MDALSDELTKVAQASTRGGFFLMSGTAIATVVLAVASILIARFLGPELYGQYALALVVPQLLFWFTDLGINQGVTKFTATLQSNGELNRIAGIIKHGLIMRAVMGFVIFAVDFVFAGPIASALLLRPELAFYIQIASISILFQVVFATINSAFVGLDKTEYQAIVTSVQATAKTLISIALILAGFGITGAIIGHTVSFIIAAVATVPLIWMVMRRMSTAGESASLKTDLKNLFHYGTPLYVSVLLAGFLPLFMNVVLAFFTTDSDIGNYKAAINFATLLTTLAIPITTVLLPAFSKLINKTNYEIGVFFKVAVKYTAMLVIPVAFLIIIFSKEIVQIIYGSTYQLASIFLSMYLLLYLLVGIGYLTLPSLYNGLGETKTTLKMNLITFLILVILSAPMTETYGVQGLIVGFIISLLIGTFYGAYTARRKYSIELDLKNTAKIYLIAGLACAFPLILKNFVGLPNLFNLLLGSVLYLLVFITLMPLTNVVSLLELIKIKIAIQNTPVLKQFVSSLIEYQQKILKLKTSVKNFAGSRF